MSKKIRGRVSFPLWGKLLAVLLLISLSVLPCLASEVGTPVYVQSYGYSARKAKEGANPSSWTSSYHHNGSSDIFISYLVPGRGYCEFLPYFGLTLTNDVSAKRFTFQDNYTYDFTFTIKSNRNTGTFSLDDNPFYFLTDEQVESPKSPLDFNEFYSFKDYTLSNSYTISRNSNATGSEYTLTLNMVFRTSTGISDLNLSIFSTYFTIVNTSTSNIYYSLYFDGGTGTYDLDGSIYQEKVLGQLTDLKNDVNSGFNQTHEDLQGLQGSIEAGQQQQHQDAEDLKNNLNSIDQSVIAGNQQAHEDSQALQNKLEQMQQQEKDEVSKNGDASDALDQANEDLNVDGLAESMKNFYNSINYSGLEASWTFPSSGNFPYVGKLWDEQEIDFNYWLNKVPSQVFICTKFLGYFAAVFATLKYFISIMNIINGERDDD